MYSAVRRYEGVTNPTEAAKRVREDFVPFISGLPGFVEYYWIDLGQSVMISVSVFDSLPNAIEGNQAAVAWVRANMASVLPQNPRVESGKVVAHKNMAGSSTAARPFGEHKPTPRPKF
jgi:hypothetical protein